MPAAIDEFIAELRQCVSECSRAERTFKSAPCLNAIKKFEQAIDEIHASWSGSSLGYHSRIYLKDFRKPKMSEFFDSAYGIQLSRSGPGKTIGEWRKYKTADVIAAIKRKAAPAELSTIEEAAAQAEQAFARTREELLALMDALLSVKLVEKADVITGLKEKVEHLSARPPESDFLDKLPFNRASKDPIAKDQGVSTPHHLLFRASLRQKVATGQLCERIRQLAAHTISYLEKLKKLGIKDGLIAIGHGRSPQWILLRDFLEKRLKLRCDEFNRVEPAGKSIKEVLSEMLDNASFAFLVLTAEDEHSDGSRHARENVVHEVGLFQGKLGFHRAIVLVEEGCSQFSNLAGINHIPFRSNTIKDTFEQVRRVLEREELIKEEGS